jgi:Amt family ammonium transporter
LGANGLAASAFVTTHVAAAAGMLAWLAASWIRHRKASVLAASAGAVAGLVGITPAAGFVTPMAAIFIGLSAGAVCFWVTEYVVRGRIDDALDVFGVHGVGGIVGALLTGVFATKTVNAAGADGLLYGNPQQLITQIVAVLVVAAYAAVVTFVLLKIIDATIGIRVSEAEENEGLDASQHGESAYTTV